MPLVEALDRWQDRLLFVRGIWTHSIQTLERCIEVEQESHAVGMVQFNLGGFCGSLRLASCFPDDYRRAAIHIVKVRDGKVPDV